MGGGCHYELTPAGRDLFRVCGSLGEWGARWLEIAPEHLDPFVALWSMCNALRRDRLPDRRVVIRFDFTGRARHERYWLLIEHGDTEICKEYPGLDEDLYITADAEAFVKWHAGQAQLGRRPPRQPHPAPRSVAARTGLPHLERPQRVRPHQAGAAITEQRRPAGLVAGVIPDPNAVDLVAPRLSCSDRRSIGHMSSMAAGIGLYGGHGRATWSRC